MAEASPPPKPGPEVVVTPPGMTKDQAQAWRMVQRLRDRVLQATATPGVQARIDGIMDKIGDPTLLEGVDPDLVGMLTEHVYELEDRATVRQRCVYATALEVSIFSDLDSPLHVHLGLWRPARKEKPPTPPPAQRSMVKTRRRKEGEALAAVARPAKKLRRDNLGRTHVVDA